MVVKLYVAGRPTFPQKKVDIWLIKYEIAKSWDFPNLEIQLDPKGLAEFMVRWILYLSIKLELEIK